MSLCLFVPGLLILSLVTYHWLRLNRFHEGAREVPAEVSWLPGGEDAAHLHQMEEEEAVRLDKHFKRRHRFVFWVIVHPPEGGAPVEAGVAGRGPERTPRIGDTLRVLYNPEMPESVALPGDPLWVSLAVLGVFGVIAILVPLFILARRGGF